MPERRLKILTLITRLNVGGPARLLRTFKTCHDPERIDWRLAGGLVGPGESTPEWAGELVDYVIPTLRRSVAPLHDARALGTIRKLIEDIEPDVVHTHTSKAGWLGRMAAHRAGVPTIHTYHGTTFDGYWGPLRGRLYRGLERSAARRSTFIVAQSEAERVTITKHLGEDIAPRMVTIPPGLDLTDDTLTQSNVSELRAELGVGDEMVVAFVGRLAAIKNCEGFLRVVRRLHQRGLRIAAIIAGAGTEPHERRLHDLVDEFGLREVVRWLGSRHDVGRIYGVADLLLLTSFNEGTPLVLAEALHGGVPVAAYDVGGVAEIVRGCPLAEVVPQQDEETLAKTAIDLLGAERTTAESREQSRAIIEERFDPRLWVDSIQELYERAAQR